jgi:transcriptional regulator with XRE-family HTH domain
MASLISGPQLRAARAMAGLDRHQLADKAGISVQSVRRLEAMGRIRANVTTVDSLQRALEAAGVEFTDDGGVRPDVRMGRAVA